MISRLFISVQSGDLEAQPVILDFVRGVFTKWVRNEKGYVSADKTKGSLHALGRNSLDANDKHATGEPQLDHAYLLATVLAGISLRSNRAMLADWLNFVMTLSSAVSDTITPILYPISRAICDQIHARLGNYTDGTTDIYSEARMDEGDIPLLFHSAVLIVRRALPGAGNASTSAFATPSSEPAGLFGYVTTVLSGESGSGRAVKAAVCLTDYLCLIASNLISLCLAHERDLGDAARRCRRCSRSLGDLPPQDTVAKCFV
jgi:hypothetical protein